jgi:hypothetical protein
MERVGCILTMHHGSVEGAAAATNAKGLKPKKDDKATVIDAYPIPADPGKID